MRDNDLRVHAIKCEHDSELSAYIEGCRRVRISLRGLTKRGITRAKTSPIALDRNPTLDEFFPAAVPVCLRTTYYKTVLFTGHGPFKSYLCKFGISGSGLCFCAGHASETVRHILIECECFKKLVEHIFHPRPQSLSDFVKDPQDKQLPGSFTIWSYFPSGAGSMSMIKH